MCGLHRTWEKLNLETPNSQYTVNPGLCNLGLAGAFTEMNTNNLLEQMFANAVSHAVLKSLLHTLDLESAQQKELAGDVALLYNMALKYRALWDALEDEVAHLAVSDAVKCFRFAMDTPDAAASDFRERILRHFATHENIIAQFSAIIRYTSCTEIAPEAAEADHCVFEHTLQRVGKL